MPSHSKPHIVSVIVHCCDFYFHWMSNQAAGFPVGYATAAPAYTPSMYPGANPAFPTGMEIPICLIFECHLVLMLPIIRLLCALCSSSSLKLSFPSLQVMLPGPLSKCPAPLQLVLYPPIPPHPTPTRLPSTPWEVPTSSRTPTHR